MKEGVHMNKKFYKKLVIMSLISAMLGTNSVTLHAKEAEQQQVEVKMQPLTEAVSIQTQKINEALTEAKKTLVKQVTVSLDKVDEEQLKTYMVPGPLVVYVRNVNFKKIDDKTLQVDIYYTTWYEAIKAFKEPKIYENKITEVAKQTLAKAKEVIKELGLEDETSAYVKEKAIHDYLISKGKYSEEIIYDISDPMHGAEGLLLNQDGICRSYAEGMQLFMEMLGVESKIILGTSLLDYQKHMWNMIKLDDGNWYYADLTWDEMIPDVEGKVNYDYFNIPEYILLKEHRPEEWQQLEPAESLDYFHYKDILAHDGNEITEIVKEQLSKGKLQGEVYVLYNTNVNNVIELVKDAMRAEKVSGEIVVTKESRKVYSFSINPKKQK